MRPDEGTRARLALLTESGHAPVAVREPVAAPDGNRVAPRVDEPVAPPADERIAPRGAPAAAAASSAGWVPGPPGAPGSAPEPTAPAPPAATDSLGIRDRALASAVAAYTAAYGHPLQAESITPGPRRWATPGRTATAAVAAVLLLGGVVVARAAQRAPSEVVALDDAQPGPGGSATLLDAGEPTDPTVVVHVVGQVQQPGVVTLPDGSRVADAVDAAGGAGPEADMSAVNLARVLVDGEQVVVPRPGEVITPVSGAGAGTGGGLLNLNVADVGALDGLPGIGPVLAQRIVDWRTEHERFSAVEELTEVSGIGPALLEGVRDLVTVG